MLPVFRSQFPPRIVPSDHSYKELQTIWNWRFLALSFKLNHCQHRFDGFVASILMACLCSCSISLETPSKYHKTLGMVWSSLATRSPTVSLLSTFQSCIYVMPWFSVPRWDKVSETHQAVVYRWPLLQQSCWPVLDLGLGRGSRWLVWHVVGEPVFASLSHWSVRRQSRCHFACFSNSFSAVIASCDSTGNALPPAARCAWYASTNTSYTLTCACASLLRAGHLSASRECSWKNMQSDQSITACEWHVN